MANLLDSASILLTPTATNNGSILAVKPENGDGDMTFSRNSAATRVNAQGLVENVASNLPRIDYTDGCGSLLLEPQSTNLITQSELFSDAYWTKSNSSVTSGFTSPKGDLSAFKLVNSAVTSTHYLSNSIAVTSGVDYTLSILAKKGEYDFITLMLQGNGWLNSTRTISFNLANGTFDYADTGITYKSTLLDNGFYIIEVTNQTISTSVNLRIYTSSTSYDVSSYLGDGTSGVYIYGAQLEQNSYATSYIPTSGAISTRLADISNNSGNTSLINSEEGTLYFEGSALADDGTSRRISISDGTNANRIFLSYGTTSNNIRAYIVAGGVNVTDRNYTGATITNSNKIAIRWGVNNFSLWVNGLNVSEDLSGATFTSSVLNDLSFNGATGGSPFYGKNKALAVYKTALTDEQLTVLTTI